MEMWRQSVSGPHLKKGMVNAWIKDLAWAYYVHNDNGHFPWMGKLKEVAFGVYSRVFKNKKSDHKAISLLDRQLKGNPYLENLPLHGARQ